MPNNFDLRLQCLPAQAPVVTTLEIREGWSQSTGQACVHVSGRNSNDALVSTVTVKGYPADCVLVPEAPPSVMLAAGLMVLAVIGRRHLYA